MSSAFLPDWNYTTRYAYLRLRPMASAAYQLDDMVQDFLLHAWKIYEKRSDDPDFTPSRMLKESYWRVIDIIRKSCGRSGQRLIIRNARSIHQCRGDDDYASDRQAFLAGDRGEYCGRMVDRERMNYVRQCLTQIEWFVLLLRNFEHSLRDIADLFGCCETRICQILSASRLHTACALATYERGDTMIDAEERIKDAIVGIPVERQYKLLLHLSKRLMRGASLTAQQRKLLKDLEEKLEAASGEQ